MQALSATPCLSCISYTVRLTLQNMKISITNDEGTAEVFKMKSLDEQQLGCAAFFSGIKPCHYVPSSASL